MDYDTLPLHPLTMDSIVLVQSVMVQSEYDPQGWVVDEMMMIVAVAAVVACTGPVP